jgi:hypothetical protein
VESFYLRPISQNNLVKVIRSCFRFAKMCLCQVKSRVKVQPKILDIILGELHVVCMDPGGGGGFSIFETSFGLQVGWFAVSVKQWLDHCLCLLLQYYQQRLLW